MFRIFNNKQARVIRRDAGHAATQVLEGKPKVGARRGCSR